MKVWLVTVGEPLPYGEGARDRLYRTGQLALHLSAHGHDVVWWTSSFDHFRKRHVFGTDARIGINNNLELRALRGCGYRRSVSVARLVDEWKIARKFASLAREDRQRPDIIVTALPPLELCCESVRLGKEQNIPVVLDMRDMWPDVFLTLAPYVPRRLVRLMLEQMFRKSHRACSGATAIIGITDGFVDWGLRRGKRKRSRFDRSFSMAYDASPPPAERIREAERFWDSHSIPSDRSKFMACFFGTLGRQLELTTIIEAARILAKNRRDFRFVICGSGDRSKKLLRLARDLPNVLLPGWIGSAEIFVLMRRSSVGLDPLPDRYDFLSTVNNKAIEYLSAGLPVISSPMRGELYELLRSNGCGLSYQCGDAQQLVEVLTRLNGDAPLLERFAENAKALFESRFSADMVCSEMTTHFEMIVSSRKMGCAIG